MNTHSLDFFLSLKLSQLLTVKQFIGKARWQRAVNVQPDPGLEECNIDEYCRHALNDCVVVQSIRGRKGITNLASSDGRCPACGPGSGETLGASQSQKRINGERIWPVRRRRLP